MESDDLETEKCVWFRSKGRDYIVSERFLRNRFVSAGKYEFPALYKSDSIDIKNMRFLGFHNTNPNDPENREKTIHFFIYDDGFETVWNNPYKTLVKLKQYKQLLSPDFSIYSDMPLTLQVFSVFKRRWCSAFWQSKGLTVIPAVAWSDERSYEFCFDGIPEGHIAAVSTLGTSGCETEFMKGFKEMCARLKPEKVICYCSPISGMEKYAEILHVEHEARVYSRKAREKRDKSQIHLFDDEKEREGGMD